MFARAALFAHIQQTLFNVETIEPRVASSGGPMMKQIVLLLVTAASLSFRDKSFPRAKSHVAVYARL
jgi:hypothetical protein